MADHGVTHREAIRGDLEEIARLLQRNDLRPKSILDPGTKYWVVQDGDRIIGSVGVELGATSVLLRSAVVETALRGKGIGRKLTFEALSWARSAGYTAAYCFSTDAGAYWKRLGFSPCSVDELVAELRDAPQTRLFADLGWLPAEEAFRISLANRNE